MNQIRKIISLLLAVILCMSLASAVLADEVEDVAAEGALFDVLDGDNELPIIGDDDDTSGTCGDYLTWVVNTDRETLTISGTGAMTDWDAIIDVPPWYSSRSYIADVTLSDGVTSIGSNAFARCTGLETITIPATVTSIGSNAFLRTAALSTVYYAGTEDDWNGIEINDIGNDYLKNANIIFQGGSVTFTWSEDHTAATARLGSAWTVDCTVTAALETTLKDGAVTAVSYTDENEKTVNRVVYTATAVSPKTDVVYTAKVEVYGLFGGWYHDTAFTKPYTEQPDGSDAAWPKLVDPVVLTVRYQISFPTYPTDASTRFRIVTTVDSLDYESVGFVLTYTKPSDGKTENVESVTNRVYRSLKGIAAGTGNTFNYTPSEAFSPESAYFCATMVPAFSSKLYYTPISIRPQWVTADGTTVYGTARVVQVSDSDSFVP